MASATTLTAPKLVQPVLLTPPSICLLGGTGAGKTDSIATFIEAGIEVFHAGTEPGACEVLVDSVKRRGLDMNLLHFHQMALTAQRWQGVMDAAATVQALNYQKLSELSDIGKREMSHFMAFLNLCKNFHDQRTGKDFGDVTEWGPNRAFIVDTLSGVNKMAREYTVGYKPTMSQGDWGVAMQLEENVIYKLIADHSCYFVLCAHIDREQDEVVGGTRLTLAALGRKLAPQLVKYFSEVILAKRIGSVFTWSTSEPNVDVKNRLLPIDNALPPSFVPIVNGYRARIDAIRQIAG